MCLKWKKSAFHFENVASLKAMTFDGCSHRGKLNHFLKYISFTIQSAMIWHNHNFVHQLVINKSALFSVNIIGKLNFYFIIKFSCDELWSRANSKNLSRKIPLNVRLHKSIENKMKKIIIIIVKKGDRRKSLSKIPLFLLLFLLSLVDNVKRVYLTLKM